LVDSNQVNSKQDDSNQVDLNQVDLNQVDLNQEIARLQAEASSEESGRKSKMLVKHPEFRIVLVTMRAARDGKTTRRTLESAFMFFVAISGSTRRTERLSYGPVNYLHLRPA
jgi:hypothetical protein